MGEMIPDQQGRIVVVQPAVPGMGADWNHQVPLRTRWHLKTVQCTLVTDIAVQDRVPELVITQNGIEVIRITASQVLAASLTFIFGWMEGERAAAVSGQTSRVAALPRGLHLNNQAVISVETVDLDIMDQWINAVIMAEEWIEPLA